MSQENVFLCFSFFDPNTGIIMLTVHLRYFPVVAPVRFRKSNVKQTKYLFHNPYGKIVNRINQFTCKLLLHLQNNQINFEDIQFE